MTKLQTVAELTSAKYQVSEHRNTITVTNSKPFKVIRGGKSVSATLHEGVYTASFTGLIVNDTLPFQVAELKESVNPFPLLSSIVESIGTKSVILGVPTTKLPFSAVKVGGTFTLEGVTYVKKSSNSYAKDRKFVQTGMDVIVEGQFDVKGLSFNVLSPEQLRNIVDDLTPGMEEDELLDQLHQVLDNVAGFESPESRDEVMDQLVNMYHEQHGAGEQSSDEFSF